MRLVLLPGLDGTGTLYAPLQQALPPHIPTRLVRYAPDRPAAYDALIAEVSAMLGDEPVLLLAESFSGPVALGVARAHEQVRGIVFVGSFIEAPRTFPAAFARAALFRTAPPPVVLRTFLAGEHAPDTLVAELSAAIRTVAPEVLAVRLQAVLRLPQAPPAPDLPVLVVQGVKDRLVPRSAGDTILAAFPRARAVDLDAPHLIAQRAPAALAELVAGFWAEIG